MYRPCTKCVNVEFIFKRVKVLNEKYNYEILEPVKKTVESI